MKERKKTIAQLRYEQVKKLACRISEDPTEKDIRNAERIMNSYYRLSGLLERCLYLSNTESTCNSKYTAMQEEKADRWIERLKKELNRYGLTLVFYGYLPTITTEPGSSSVINTYFYN